MLLLQNSIRHTLSVRKGFVRLPCMSKKNLSGKSWWTLSDYVLRKQSRLESSSSIPLLPVTKENHVSQGTQTAEQLLCERCSCSFIMK